MFAEIVFNHWFWFVLLLILGAFEMMMPGVIFIWLAIASGAVGGIVYVFPKLDWQYQFVIFSVLGLVSVFGGRSYLKRHPVVSDDENLNNRGARFVGNSYTLVQDMKNGGGKIRIGDTLWNVEGDFEAREGDDVRVKSASGIDLVVEKIE